LNELNMQIVREFFELNLFHVLTHWQHETLPQLSESGSLLFVEHINPETECEPEFVLRPEDLPCVFRAVVEVRAWHNERFYASVAESSPALRHVVERETLALAESVFGSSEFRTILVLSELPGSQGPRERAIQVFREFGVDHILEFPVILRDILGRISAQGNYAPSQTLQTMRLLKRYNLIRRQQLEFTFPSPPPPPARPVVHADPPAEEEDEG
jgi:hypothetical protein